MVISQTPFRISFFGGGTDYPAWYTKNGGAVLSAAIDKYCYITCRYLPPYFEHKSRIAWSKIELVKNVDEIQHPSVRESLKFLGINRGVEVQIHNDVPARSGLGASSSFAVGLLNALNTLLGNSSSKERLALDAIHIEQEKLKENVGSQDQVAAAFGGLNKIEFGIDGKINVKPASLDPHKIKQLEDHMMIFFTGLVRNASDVAKEQIKNIPQKESELRTMYSYVNEAESILTQKDFITDFGKLLHENWRLKRGLSSKITNLEIDEMYNTGMNAGAFGGKLLGAGGGGFILFLISPEKQAFLREKLAKLIHVPVKFEKNGSKIIYNNPEGDTFETSNHMVTES